MALTGDRSGVVARDRIGPQQERQALENVTHFDRGQNADAVDEPRAIDGPVLGDVYNTGTRKSCLASS